jgi:integrase
MSIVTFAAAAQAACALYRGRDAAFSQRIAFWVERLGERELASLTNADVEDGIDALVQKPRERFIPGRGLLPMPGVISGSTVNRYVAALGTAFKLLRAHRRLPRGFVTPTQRVGRMPENEGRTLTVTVDDVKCLIAAARLSRNRKLAAITAVACTSGLRLGALQALKWGDVDLKARTIDVARTKNGRPTRSVLPAWAVAELERIRPNDPPEHALVFGAQNFRKAWFNALSDAGLPTEWTFHHCRHIAASILAQSGATLPVIMQALGHRSPLMAMRYSHVNTKALDAAVSSAWAA